MPTKRTTKTDEQTTDQQPSGEHQPQPQATAEEQPWLRRCPTHQEYFPEESDRLPREAYRWNKTTGKLAQTYCARCQSQRAKAYRQQHPKAAKTVQPDLKAWIEEAAEVMGRVADADLDAQDTLSELQQEALQILDRAPYRA